MRAEIVKVRVGSVQRLRGWGRIHAVERLGYAAVEAQKLLSISLEGSVG